MKKGNLLLMAVAMGLLLLLAGCGEGDDGAETKTTAGEATVAETHDCEGACGMTAVPADKLTEVDGKFYCAGCAGKAKAEAAGESKEAEDEHKGHSHG